MMTDPIADLLTRIKNAYMARKEQVIVPYSIMGKSIVGILSKKGYIGAFSVMDNKETRKTLEIELLYEGKRPQVTNITRMSKPGRRMYVQVHTIPTILGGMGDVIISTPQGLMSGDEAKKKRVGGEIICKIW